MTAFEIIGKNLSDLIALPDPQAAVALNLRMEALDHLHHIHERSFAERGIIAREVERRALWKHLISPETGEPFPHFTAWISSGAIGCRRTTFEALRDMEMLEDVPSGKLIDIPKGNLKVLTQVSTAVRNHPEILDAAKTLSQDQLLAKLESEHPLQHIETRRSMRFRPTAIGSRAIEAMIEYAIEKGIAGSRDEAIVRAAETALAEWHMEEELEDNEVKA